MTIKQQDERSEPYREKSEKAKATKTAEHIKKILRKGANSDVLRKSLRQADGSEPVWDIITGRKKPQQYHPPDRKSVV